ncbi:MAG: N-acetylmuramoyl-L-alanine amidase [Mesorhizobium sp.]|nr:N-acetylmuramoyl-L-alanine amidase [Mesorhizobium sp.]
MSGFAPDFAGAEVRVSPNFGPRRDVTRPDIVILHYTGMASAEAAEAWLCDPSSEVSAHYLVHEDGRIVQMVREADRAWHAGKGSWHGHTDINSRSIGVEIANPGAEGGFPDFADIQIDAVIRLIRDITARCGILAERVLAHSDVAPGRKIDPGAKFPWRRLFEAGVGHLAVPERDCAVPPSAAGDQGRHVEQLQSMLQLYGYGVEISGFFDPATKAAVEAFQLHFRPACADGAADKETLATLYALLASLPGGTG